MTHSWQPMEEAELDARCRGWNRAASLWRRREGEARSAAAERWRRRSMIPAAEPRRRAECEGKGRTQRSEKTRRVAAAADRTMLVAASRSF